MISGIATAKIPSGLLTIFSAIQAVKIAAEIIAQMINTKITFLLINTWLSFPHREQTYSAFLL